MSKINSMLEDEKCYADEKIRTKREYLQYFTEKMRMEWKLFLWDEGEIPGRRARQACEEVCLGAQRSMTCQ